MFVDKGNEDPIHIELFLNDRSDMGEIRVLVDPVLPVIIGLDVKRHLGQPLY
jgi:hypothetical protein